MDKKQNYLLGISYALFLTVASFGTYIKLWEANQPERKIQQTRIEEIIPYITYNEMRSNGGYNIKIDSEDNTINFPIKNWKENTEEGDLVNLVVRKIFFGSKLKGLSIQNNSQK